MNLAKENILNYVLVILVVRNIFNQDLNQQNIDPLGILMTINSSKEMTLENIYKDLESGMPENKSIKDYTLPNARQWLGGRFFAVWVLPIFFINKKLFF